MATAPGVLFLHRLSQAVESAVRGTRFEDAANVWKRTQELWEKYGPSSNEEAQLAPVPTTPTDGDIPLPPTLVEAPSRMISGRGVTLVVLLVAGAGGIAYYWYRRRGGGGRRGDAGDDGGDDGGGGGGGWGRICFMIAACAVAGGSATYYFYHGGGFPPPPPPPENPDFAANQLGGTTMRSELGNITSLDTAFQRSINEAGLKCILNEIGGLSYPQELKVANEIQAETGMKRKAQFLKPKGVMLDRANCGKGPGAPDAFNCAIEIPRGSKVKYELDKAACLIKVDRVLYSSVSCSHNYGAQEHPLLMQLLCNITYLSPVHGQLFPGYSLGARAIVLMPMIDQGKKDDNIIAICAVDHGYRRLRDTSELPPHHLQAIGRLFEDNKKNENKEVAVNDFVSAEDAINAIKHSMDLSRFMCLEGHTSRSQGKSPLSTKMVQLLEAPVRMVGRAELLAKHKTPQTRSLNLLSL